VLKAGDVAKIDLGVHIDNFIAVAAHTIVVGEEETTGATADVIIAAYTAAEVALRLIKPGNTNTQVTEGIASVAAAYGVTPVAGVLSHEMRQQIIDGNKVILLRGDDPEVKVEEFTFGPNEVYSIDIVFSTGEGKPRESDNRVTVYKLAPESTYQVKMKASKFVVGEAMHRFGFMPFVIRALGDDKEVRTPTAYTSMYLCMYVCY
jgi:curved DNA binding protein